uniref:Putative secreted protein n=1 Tax=Anopheles marajoara TaxID=58244 RepID=A0A2M4CBR2_9DIPT
MNSVRRRKTRRESHHIVWLAGCAASLPVKATATALHSTNGWQRAGRRHTGIIRFSPFLRSRRIIKNQSATRSRAASFGH